MAVTREVSRETNLPAFSIGLGELELIWSRLLSLFESSDEPMSLVWIELPGEKLTFRSPQELQQHQFTSSRARSFSVSVSAKGRSVMILSPGIFGSSARVIASGESEIWCAGAKEAVVGVIDQNKVWHFWLRPAFVGVLLFALTIGGSVAQGFVKGLDPKVSSAFSYAYAGTAFVLLALFMGREKLLPTATLRLREDESFIRRRMPELTLLVAVVSAILAGVGLFLGK